MRKLIKHAVFFLIGLSAVILLIVVVQQKKTISPQESTIISLDSLNVPMLESHHLLVPDFASFSNIVEKKKAFFAYLLPEIRRQNTIVLKEREMVFALIEVYKKNKAFNTHQQQVFDFLKKKYQLSKVKSDEVDGILSQLVMRVDIIPEALILVQAANESGWGTSRFARQGYNFFGLWCFKLGCGFVPRQRHDGAEHEVAKFRDLSHAIMTYVRNLNRLYAYQHLRQIRIDLRQQNAPVTAEALAYGLMSYSERGQDYIDELHNMIRVNRKYMDAAL